MKNIKLALPIPNVTITVEVKFNPNTVQSMANPDQFRSASQETNKHIDALAPAVPTSPNSPEEPEREEMEDIFDKMEEDARAYILEMRTYSMG